MSVKQFYESETKTLSRKYARGQSPPERYIALCETHTLFLQSKIMEELDYVYLFQYVLIDVKETFRPDYFINEFTGKYRQVLDVEFMIYFLDVRDQLTSQIEWNVLCRLNANYAIWKVDWLIEKRDVSDLHRSDKFLEYAIKEVKLRELYKYSVPDENICLKDLVV